MKNKITCPRCKRPVAKKDGRRRPSFWEPAPGVVELLGGSNAAPRYRCPCGKAVVFMLSTQGGGS